MGARKISSFSGSSYLCGLSGPSLLSSPESLLSASIACFLERSTSFDTGTLGCVGPSQQEAQVPSPSLRLNSSSQVCSDRAVDSQVDCAVLALDEVSGKGKALSQHRSFENPYGAQSQCKGQGAVLTTSFLKKQAQHLIFSCSCFDVVYFGAFRGEK